MAKNQRTPASVQIGQVLRELRKRDELTMHEMAAKLEVSQQCVSAWEHGDRAPRIEDIPTIARAVGQTPLWLARKMLDRLAGKTTSPLDT